MMKWMVFSSEIYYLLVGLWFLALWMLPNAGSRRNYFSALFLVIVGVFPVVGGLFSIIPNSVLGGATILMFGTVAAAGISPYAS